MDQMNILGVHVSATNMPEAVGQIKTWIANRTRTYVCVTGVHGIMECQDNLRLRTIHNSAGMVTPDGMPLVYISRAGGHARTTRVYGPDLMAAMCEDSVGSGYRHFFYGAAPATLAKLVERIGGRFPGIQIAGSYSPPYRDLTPEEERSVVEEINHSQADVVWVGIGVPKQEKWMAAFRERLDAPVLVGVGAAFDFHAGLVPQAPDWMQRTGLEWAYRLAHEPRRLWKRYAKYNPAFVVGFVRQWRRHQRR